MTKEELKKEAEENSFRYTLDKPWVCEVERKQIMAHFEKGYLAGAEPREKRIVELEGKLEQTEKDLADYQFNYPTIKELKKENAELKADNDARKFAMTMSEKVEKQLREQLTKAKVIIKNLLILKDDHFGNTKMEWRVEVTEQAEQFLKEIE